MTFNAALAEQALAAIKADKKNWKQDTWRCETGMCFAGWVATVDHGRWAFSASDDFHPDKMIARKNDPEDCVIGIGSKRVIPVRDRAQHLLGLDFAESCQLFDANNNLGDLRRIVREFKKAAKESANGK